MTTKEFIREHRTDDVRQLALRGCADPSVDMPFALDQIAGWQTARKKLPTWAATEDIIYPPHLNMEQCSSEKTARYKQFIINNSQSIIHNSAESTMLIDLTGGFGVDFSFMAKGLSRAVYVERDERLCRIARHNFKVLGFDNVEVVNADALSYLSSLECCNHKAQSSMLKAQRIIFLDPARRDAHGRKVFGIEDCTPDVLQLKGELLSKADVVIIKLSPMLDWHAAAKAFGNSCREVHIVSVGNECKELLLVLSNMSMPSDNSKDATCQVVCVNDDTVFRCQPTSDNDVTLTDSDDAKYLYVPNASVMKAGVFVQLTDRFPVAMIDKNSHLFLGNEDIEDFPGRKFLIRVVTTMNKKKLRRNLAGISQANVSVRNFPLSADALRSRLKLKDGGNTYLFATTALGKHIIIVAETYNEYGKGPEGL